MVASELQPLARRRSQRGWRRWGLGLVAVAAVAVAVAVVTQLGQGEGAQPAELLAGHGLGGHGKRLSAKEKAFVELATSTPNVDLHKATKLKDTDGANDMNKWYDHQATTLRAKNTVAAEHLDTMKKKASTTAAKRNINAYFDKMAVAVKHENQHELQKNMGTGRAARAEMNLYFKQLAESQEGTDKHDMERLRAQKRFDARHGTAIAAAKDINSWFDRLQEKTKEQTAAERAAKPKEDPYAFVTPEAARHKGGEAVKVHRHDEEGIQESGKQALNDINSYFDDLETKQRMHNEADRAALNKHDEFKSETDRELDAKASQRDIDHYWSKMHETVSGRDAADRAALRKDNNPVNFHDGVNLAVHPLHHAAHHGGIDAAKRALRMHAAAKRLEVHQARKAPAVPAAIQPVRPEA